MSATEQAIHVTIAVFLNRALPEGSWHCAIDSAGKASIGVAQRLKARGGKRGTPDHLVLTRGFPAITFEVKTDIGRVSDSQDDVAKQIAHAGHYWCLVRSVEDVEAALRHIGVPLRATVAGIRVRIATQNEGLRPVRKRTSKPRTTRPTQAQVRRAEANRLLP